MLIEPKYNELRTVSNLTCQTSNSFEPRFVHQNRTSNPFEPCKMSELRTFLARNRSNPSPNLEKPNFEPFRTQVRQLKSNYEPTRTLQKSRTSNPRTGFDPTLFTIRSKYLSVAMFPIVVVLQERQATISQCDKMCETFHCSKNKKKY